MSAITTLSGSFAKQLSHIVAVLRKCEFRSVVIAYEPVWAIGSGQSASPDIVQKTHEFIRLTITKLDASITSKVKIIYGGSLNPSTSKEILKMDAIDGGLVGGASLNIQDLSAIANSV